MIRLKSKNELAIMAGAGTIAFVLDRLSKIWALDHLTQGQMVPFLPGLLQFNLTMNTGAAFSLGRGHAPLMTAIACLYTAGFLVWGLMRVYRAERPAILERLGAGLIIGASCGNLYERFVQGKVTDFLEFSFFSFPIFNVADALIDTGVVLIIIQFLFLDGRKNAS